MTYLPNIIESLMLALFAGDYVARGHASDVAGIVAVLLIRAAFAALEKRMEIAEPAGGELQGLRDQLDQLKADVSRVSLVVGMTNK